MFEAWSSVRRSLNAGARLAATTLSRKQAQASIEAQQTADQMLEELDRLAERNEALRQAARQRSETSAAELCRHEIADLRARTVRASQDLVLLWGRRLKDRRHALDVLRVEIQGVNLELGHREWGQARRQ